MFTNLAIERGPHIVEINPQNPELITNHQG